MASVDGARSGDKPSDVFNACDPCQHSGVMKQADKFCVQCQEYMCELCATTHKGLKQLRNHKMVSGSHLPSRGQSGGGKLSLEYCEEHKDKTIDWLCEKHDVMCCDTCKRVQHRKCEVTSITDLPQSSTPGQQLAKVMGSLTALKRRIDHIKKDRDECVDVLESLRSSCVDDVRHFTTKLVELVRRLEREMLAEIQEIVTVEKNVLDEQVETCESLSSQVDAGLETADAATSAGHVTSVIAGHKLSKTPKSLDSTVSDMELEIYNFNISFQPSRILTDLSTGVDRLGTLDIHRAKSVFLDPPMSECRKVGHASARTSLADMTVESSTQINVSSDWISGSAVMADGRIILVDNSNNQLLLLDTTFNITSTVELPRHPWDVAVDGANDGVVSVPEMKQLRYFHVDTGLQAGRTLTTRGQCGGVAVYKGEVYVTVYTDGVGRVDVLDRRGNVTRSIGETPCIGKTPRGTQTGYITVNARGSVFVTDYRTGHITCLTNGGDVVYRVQHDDMSSPHGMVVDDDDNLLVCCAGSDAIHVLRKDGTQHKVILSSADGVKSPHSVSYRRVDNTLVVTMWNTPSCRAYTLQ